MRIRKTTFRHDLYARGDLGDEIVWRCTQEVLQLCVNNQIILRVDNVTLPTSHLLPVIVFKCKTVKVISSDVVRVRMMLMDKST